MTKFPSDEEATPIGSHIEIDKEALATSLKGANEYDGRYAVGFKCYEINTPQGTFPIIPSEDEAARLHGISQLNINNISYHKRPKVDNRSRFQKFRDDWARRLSHAWYALKGNDCD